MPLVGRILKKENLQNLGARPSYVSHSSPRRSPDMREKSHDVGTGQSNMSQSLCEQALGKSRESHYQADEHRDMSQCPCKAGPRQLGYIA